MIPVGFVSVIGGWVVTEVGRQPWTVYGLLRTADSVSPSLTGVDVALSLAGYSLVYILVFATGLAWMLRIVRAGPAAGDAVSEDEIESGRPRQPVRALPVGQAGSRG